MKGLLFVIAIVFITFPFLPPPQNINAEEIKLVTYYPSPSGAFTKLGVGNNTPVPADYNAAAGKYNMMNIGTKVNESIIGTQNTTKEGGMLQVGGTVETPYCSIFAWIPAAGATAIYGWGGSGSFRGWSGTFLGGYGCWIDNLYISDTLIMYGNAKIRAGSNPPNFYRIYAENTSGGGAAVWANNTAGGGVAVYGINSAGGGAAVQGYGSSGWSGVFTGGTGAYIDNLYISQTIRTIGAHPGSSSKHLYDIAEDISAPECESGDVVIIDPDNDTQVIKTATKYSTAVAGIISETPVFHIGKTEGFKPLALAGRVITKVTTENGHIKRGDLLVTSSKPGYAMKADLDKLKYGMVIGKALQELIDGEGKIEVLVTGH